MFNYQKLKTSALIMVGGILISTIPIITNNVIAILNDGDMFDWKTPVILTMGAVSTWIVATIRNYIKS